MNTEGPPSHYDLLEVAVYADGAHIRRAYRRQAQRWHPDRHGGTTEAHDRFVRIRHAYDVLSDPQRRADYDRQQAQGHVPPPPAPAPAQTAVGRRGDDLHLETWVPWNTLRTGGRVQVVGKVGVRCPRCSTGCALCGYGGQVLITRRWSVDVPAGQRPGQWLRFAGAGHTGPFFPRPGDVYLRLLPRSSHGWRWNPRRERVERSVRVPRAWWATGGRLHLRSPDGRWEDVSIPAAARWVELQGLVTGPEPAWLRIQIGLWFSWSTRRSSRG